MLGDAQEEGVELLRMCDNLHRTHQLPSLGLKQSCLDFVKFYLELIQTMLIKNFLKASIKKDLLCCKNAFD